MIKRKTEKTWALVVPYLLDRHRVRRVNGEYKVEAIKEWQWTVLKLDDFKDNLRGPLKACKSRSGEYSGRLYEIDWGGAKIVRCDVRFKTPTRRAS